MDTKKSHEALLARVRDLEKKIVEYQQIETELDKVRKELAGAKESERKYRNILESIQEGYFEVDIEGNFTFVNKAVSEALGLSKEQLMNSNYREYATPETAEKMFRIFNDVYESGSSGNISEFEIITRGRKRITVELTTSPVTKKEGEIVGFRGIVRDITDRSLAESEKQKLELQLQQAQKMEAIGTLAGGIAHDFNNILMGIQGNTSLMLLHMPADHPHQEKLKNIESYIQGGAGLTRQLLAFAREEQYESKPTNINELLQKTAIMFGRTKKEIRIHGKYQEDVWPVNVDPGQISQVFLNLFVNAWQAMPGGGDLYLASVNATLDENQVKGFNLDPGRFVKISVTDTGTGMREEVRLRIFDPFFTTKEMGRGTGLGLASAYGIIKNHHGMINAYSEEGQGTTFNIYLPVSDEKILPEQEMPGTVLTGTETILFVDDEVEIMNLGQEILETLGYQVLTVTSGEEALKVFKTHLNKIALVILDMIMPDMSGGEVYDRMREIDGNIKVLLSSGYSVNGQANDILGRGCNGFIQKPFNLVELSRKIREILEND
jgi:PAS domain S-box-containing protein